MEELPPMGDVPGGAVGSPTGPVHTELVLKHAAGGPAIGGHRPEVASLAKDDLLTVRRVGRAPLALSTLGPRELSFLARCEIDLPYRTTPVRFSAGKQQLLPARLRPPWAEALPRRKEAGVVRASKEPRRASCHRHGKEGSPFLIRVERNQVPVRG